MVKSDLVQKLCNLHPEIYKSDIIKIVDIFFNTIGDNLAKEICCELRSFGTFKIKNRKARDARNPKTGERVAVEKKKIPYFKMSKFLKKKINENI